MTRTKRLLVGIGLGIAYLMIGFFILSDLQSMSVSKYFREAGYHPETVGWGFIICGVGYLWAGIKRYGFNAILIIPFALYTLMTVIAVFNNNITPIPAVIYVYTVYRMCVDAWVDWRAGRE